jgi:hypothetical protein
MGLKVDVFRLVLVVAGAGPGGGTTGVDARGVVSSCKPAKTGEETFSALVRLSEEANLSECVTSRFTGSSRPKEMTLVELLSP